MSTIPPLTFSWQPAKDPELDQIAKDLSADLSELEQELCLEAVDLPDEAFTCYQAKVHRIATDIWHVIQDMTNTGQRAEHIQHTIKDAFRNLRFTANIWLEEGLKYRSEKKATADRSHALSQKILDSEVDFTPFSLVTAKKTVQCLQVPKNERFIDPDTVIDTASMHAAASVIKVCDKVFSFGLTQVAKVIPENCKQYAGEKLLVIFEKGQEVQQKVAQSVRKVISPRDEW